MCLAPRLAPPSAEEYRNFIRVKLEKEFCTRSSALGQHQEKAFLQQLLACAYRCE